MVVAAATAIPAWAMPPPGADPPPDRPPRTPTTTTPPTTTPRVLDTLVVDTDSVVATATIRYNGAPGTVTVDWGDNTVSSRDPNDPSDGPRPDPNPDPPGTITFRHAYAAPASGAAFTTAITARIGAESVTHAVVVSPRFRVTQYQARFRPVAPCDLLIEDHTEWRIVRDDGNGNEDRRWEFDLLEPHAWVGDYPGTTYELPGSSYSYETTVHGYATTPRKIRYRISELDVGFDAWPGNVFIDLDPGLGSRSEVRSVGLFEVPVATDCAAEIRADVGVTLLKPGLGGGPVAHQ